METEICNCGHEFCTGIKYWATNPYSVEINDDDSAYFECDGSRYEASMDI